MRDDTDVKPSRTSFQLASQRVIALDLDTLKVTSFQPRVQPGHGIVQSFPVPQTV
jgi:hypothetical protein